MTACRPCHSLSPVCYSVGEKKFTWGLEWHGPGHRQTDGLTWVTGGLTWAT
eukprot:gene26341-biopygen15949